MSVKKYIISIAMVFALIAVSLSAVSAADANNLDDVLRPVCDLGNNINEGSSVILPSNNAIHQLYNDIDLYTFDFDMSKRAAL